MIEPKENQVWIEMLNGPRDGTVLEFNKSDIVIGSDLLADLSLPSDKLAAGNHAKLVADKDSCRLEVLQTDAETTVDGEPIAQTALLTDSSIVRIGNTEMLCRRSAAFASDATATTSVRQAVSHQENREV